MLWPQGHLLTLAQSSQREVHCFGGSKDIEYATEAGPCHLLFDHFQFTLIHGPNIPGSYAILFFSIGLYFHHQSHPQLGVVFALAPSLHSFWSYFSIDLQ